MPDDATSLAAAPAADVPWVTRDVRRILVTQVVFGFGWSLYLLIPKFLTTQLRAPPDIIGQISASGGLAGLVTIPFAARLLDRMDRRVFFRVGALLIVLLSLGFTQVHAISPLVYLLQGCVSASFVLSFNATAALMTDYAPPEKLGQAIGWLGGANVAMNAVATMVAEPLAEHYGWNAVFALGTCAGAAAFAMSFALRTAPPRATSVASEVGARKSAVLGVVPVLISATIMGGAFIAVFGFVQPFAISLGAREVRGFYLGFTLAAVGGRVFLGGLGDRVGRRAVSAWMLLGYGAAALITSQLEPDVLVLYGLAFGAAHGILYPTMNALLLEILPDRRRGLGMVLYNGAFNLGASVGSLGWGILAKQSGYPLVYVVAAGCAVLAAGLLVSARPARR